MPNILNLEATLVANQAFILVPKADLNIAGIELPYNWLSQFETTLDCHFNNGHLLQGYAQVDALKESLRVVYIYYHGLHNNGRTDANLQGAIKDKIIEGAAHCTPGFHNRVNQIITGFQLPNTIDALLMHYRTEIVSRAASAYTDDVHGHNQFAIVANQLGKNVDVLNPNDPYRLIGGNVIPPLISEAFRQHYHPLAIIDNVVTAYKSVLIGHHDYTGIKAAGYEAGDYDEWRVYLEKLLGMQEGAIGLADFLIMDEETFVVTDINWSYVTHRLAEKLLEKRCFRLTAQQFDFIRQLTASENDFAQFDSATALTLIPDVQTFTRILELLASKQQDDKLLPFFNAYCQRHGLNDIEKQAIIRQFLQKPALAVLINALIPAHRAFFVEELLRVEHGTNGLMRALQYPSRALLLMYIGLLPNLSADELQRLFVTTVAGGANNPLMLAAASAPWALEALIAHLANQQAILQDALRQTNQRRENALMIAVNSGALEAIDAISIAFMGLPDEDFRRVLFTPNTPDGANALGLAASKNLETFNLLFAYLSNLGEIDVVTALSSVDIHGNNLLLRAIRANQPQVVARLLELAAFYLDGGVNALLRQNNAANENFFMYALRFQHDLVADFILSLQAMDVDTRRVFLLETDVCGRNLLMLSLEYAPQFYNDLSAFYNVLNDADQIVVYQAQDNVSSLNVLMLALIKQIDQVPNVIANLAALDILPAVLRHQSHVGHNVLMLASRQGANALAQILPVVVEQGMPTLRVLLSQRGTHGENAFDLSFESGDQESTKLLLIAINGLGVDLRQQLIENIKPQYMAAETAQAGLVRAARLLDILEVKSHDLDLEHPEAAIAAAQVHQNLKRTYDDYLHANITQAQFARAWQDEIVRAKHSPLVNHRGYKDIAAILLLCLSVVGLLVIAAKAAHHYVKDGNMRFFHVTKTRTEICLDDMAHQAKVAAPAA